MKKPKMSLGQGGVKGLFVQHVEKIVFGVAVLFVFVFIFLGYRLESELTGKTPDGLQELAVNAVRNIERSTAEEVKKERIPREGKGGQYVARVDIARSGPDPTIYQTDRPWDLPPGKSGMKREDPQLYPPSKFEITALTGPLCVKSEEEGPLADLEDAPADVEKPKGVKKARTGRRGSGGYPGMMGPGMGGPGMSGPGMIGPGMMGDGSEMGGYMGGYGEDGKGKDDRKDRDRDKEKVKGPSRKYPADKVEGYRPMSSGGGMYGGMGSGDGSMMGPGMSMPGMSMPGAGSAGSAQKKAVGKPTARSQHMIAVKALAPYRKQYDEFKRVLGEATGYDPVRDAPRIVFFQVERADMTDNPTKEPEAADWKLIMHTKKAAEIAENEKWDGTMQEVADPNYVDPSITMPGPPMMLRDMDAVMLHSEVPRSTMVQTRQSMDEGEEVKEEEEPEDQEGADLPGGIASGGNMRGGYPGMMGGGYPGMPGGYPGMPGGYPGMAGGSGSSAGMSMPPMDSRGSGFPGMAGGSGEGMSMPMGGGYPGMPGAYGGMPGAYGGMPGGYGGYGGRFGAGMEPAQFKLVRFFDMNVEPGRVYRYRVRLFLEDPNNPNSDPRNGAVNMAPRRRTLSMKVIDRLNKQQEDPKTKNVYYVVTDWSAPSEPVSLPSTSRAYVSDVSPTRYAMGVEGTQVLQSEVQGSVVPVVWNESRAVDVAKEMRAFRGSILNTRPPFDVLDPVSLVIKILKDYELRSQYLVVDMRGGEDLPGDRKNKVTSIGEYMMMDDQGNLIVRNELDDHDNFRRFTLEDDINMRGSGGFGGYGSGMGYPGMGSSGPGGPMMGGSDPSSMGAGPGGYPGMPGNMTPGSGGGSRRGGGRPRR